MVLFLWFFNESPSKEPPHLLMHHTQTEGAVLGSTKVGCCIIFCRTFICVVFEEQTAIFKVNVETTSTDL
jgi:hypothetical protein